MARDGGSDSNDDQTIVPITAPGSAPRDFTLSPASSADTARSTDRDSAIEGHRTDRSPSASADDLRADGLVTGESETSGPDPTGSPGHVVGHDRLADVVTTFGATLDAIRASQGRAPRHNLPTGSGTNQKRIAQVVQATPIDATQVVELIRSNAARSVLLGLDAHDPAVGRGDVVFPGRLRMPGGTRRRVELRVYPTASGNLTVLELLPRRSWMPQTRRYLRAGVPAITALSDAIEAAAE